MNELDTVFMRTKIQMDYVDGGPTAPHTIRFKLTIFVPHQQFRMSGDTLFAVISYFDLPLQPFRKNVNSNAIFN